MRQTLSPIKPLFLPVKIQMMKANFLFFILLLAGPQLWAQAPCTGHPLFTAMPNHTPQGCIEKAFEELEIYQNDPVKGQTIFKKQGHENAVDYKFNGDWNSRPSLLQIRQNYSNAIKKAGGQVLYDAGGSVYGKISKSDGIYWIQVYSDGSGYYSIKSVREEAMKQDVVATAAEIKNDVNTAGKVIFYGIYFDTDKAVIKPESDPTLKEIAKFLRDNTGTNVFIVGHTDNAGDFNHNMTLSKDRANAVANELVSKYGIGKNQITPGGVGPLSPLASNETKDGMAKNRRVELVKKN
jgi:outer membrane protein OmpA-like peptidoglycan-associated protein